jgi:uncharacterized protein involved in exopolysaccharide biosynthesis
MTKTRELRLAEYKDTIARLGGQMDVFKGAIKRSLKLLKKSYGIESTRVARARKKEIEKKIEGMLAQREKYEAEAEELMNELDR